MRQQELFSAQLSGMRDASFVQQQAVQRARRAIGEAEGKLNVCKQWNRNTTSVSSRWASRSRNCGINLSHDLGHAIVFLSE